MSTFYIYAEGEALNVVHLTALEKAIGEFVQSDIPLAVEFITVSAEEIQKLNAQTRGVDRVTDVLSYPSLDGVKGKAIVGEEHPYDIDEEGRLVIGSIAICTDKAKEQAQEYGHSYERELHYLLVHGVMHCLGYDHITDEEKTEMRACEERVLTKLGITRE